MDLHDIDWNRLDRYASGHGTPEELAELERWVNASGERRVIADSLRAAGRPAGEPAHEWDVRAASRQVARRMRWFDRPRETPVVPRRMPGWAIGLAAAIIAVVSVGTGLTLRSRRPTAAPASSALPAREVVTRRGERATFNLADGSKVVLAAESRLVIPAAYNTAAGGRELTLEGEAYFEVTHDSLRPFRVATKGGIAEDLGTEFVLTSYPETAGMQVVVAAGLVGLRRPAALAGDTLSVATLARGDLGTLDAAGQVTLRRVDPRKYLAWTNGALVFDGTPLRDALYTLGRWYDVDIRLADGALASRPLTAKFKGESVSQVLDLIALSLNVEVQRHDRAIVLAPKRH